MTLGELREFMSGLSHLPDCLEVRFTIKHDGGDSDPTWGTLDGHCESEDDTKEVPTPLLEIGIEDTGELS